MTVTKIQSVSDLRFKIYDNYLEKNQTATIGVTISQLKKFHKISPTKKRIKIKKIQSSPSKFIKVSSSLSYEKYFDALKAQFLLDKIDVKLDDL